MRKILILIGTECVDFIWFQSIVRGHYDFNSRSAIDDSGGGGSGGGGGDRSHGSRRGGGKNIVKSMTMRNYAPYDVDIIVGFGTKEQVAKYGTAIMERKALGKRIEGLMLGYILP